MKDSPDKSNDTNKAPATETPDLDPAETVETEVESAPKLSELEQAQLEASEMKTRYLRSVADLENYRKRMMREKSDILRLAATGVIESLLPVLDNMKLGLQAAENHPEAKDVTLGFKMVDSQLKKTLADQGLEELIPDGEVFDPNFHECIAQQPSEEIPEDRVITTTRAGYKLNDRLIRAPSVIVSSGPNKEDA
jgi:molecular chaperone GrpE